ncbi:MAG: hypothetical protein ABSB71_14070, partial [Candidatus Bathyarchaeia archaeon]
MPFLEVINLILHQQPVSKKVYFFLFLCWLVGLKFNPAHTKSYICEKAPLIWEKYYFVAKVFYCYREKV